MTTVIAWVEVERDVDEPATRARDIREGGREFLKVGTLPDRTRLTGGWVYGLQSWAIARGMAVEFGADALDISVELDRDQLTSFIEEVCDAVARRSLQAEIDALGEREAHFKICAQEF